jgi:hypothetical protein
MPARTEAAVSRYVPATDSEPFPGCEAEAALSIAAACLLCGAPAPCTLACPQQAAVPAVMRWIGRNGCAGFSLQRWAAACEAAERRYITDQIAAAYNH